VPGKYLDATLAQIQRSQAFTKERGGETLVCEAFSAVAEREIRLSVTYQPGGMMILATADQPSLPLRSEEFRRSPRFFKRIRSWTWCAASP
jgi:hypothetical protein